MNFTSFAILLLFLLHFHLFSSENCIQKFLLVNSSKPIRANFYAYFPTVDRGLEWHLTYISNQMTSISISSRELHVCRPFTKYIPPFLDHSFLKLAVIVLLLCFVLTVAAATKINNIYHIYVWQYIYIS